MIPYILMSHWEDASFVKKICSPVFMSFPGRRVFECLFLNGWMDSTRWAESSWCCGTIRLWKLVCQLFHRVASFKRPLQWHPCQYKMKPWWFSAGSSWLWCPSACGQPLEVSCGSFETLTVFGCSVPIPTSDSLHWKTWGWNHCVKMGLLGVTSKKKSVLFAQVEPSSHLGWLLSKSGVAFSQTIPSNGTPGCPERVSLLQKLPSVFCWSPWCCSVDSENHFGRHKGATCRWVPAQMDERPVSWGCSDNATLATNHHDQVPGEKLEVSNWQFFSTCKCDPAVFLLQGGCSKPCENQNVWR